MRNKNMFMIFLLIWTIFNLRSLTGSEAEATDLPKAYLISNVPHHKQITDFSCGPGSLEMLYDYWGKDIDQKAISDVVRLSLIGTYTWDMRRAGCFSHLSAAQGRFFPYDAPDSGYPERSLGYASFDYSSDTMWWSTLKGLIVKDIPVVLLMKYAPDDDAAHYRVLVGYDEEKGVVYFLDPWYNDPDMMENPDGTVTWSMADFENAWNYAGYGTSRPYWGTVMIPWKVILRTTDETTSGSVIEVTAEITYPCPQPFDCSAYTATDTCAEIILPPNTRLLEGSSTVYIGLLQAGESVTVTWQVRLDTDVPGSSIRVTTSGLISGSVPEIDWKDEDDECNKNGKKEKKDKDGTKDKDTGDRKGNEDYYPAYIYTDKIGGEASIEL
ncbi:MAG: C39 family peptidase [Candidatus Brocadia sp.]|nr:C39 family peptidase [Candidatus Brocadia sp.]